MLKMKFLIKEHSSGRIIHDTLRILGKWIGGVDLVMSSETLADDIPQRISLPPPLSSAEQDITVGMPFFPPQI